MPDALIVEWIRSKYESLVGDLTERARRHWAAVEAISLGRGGIAAVAEATGISDRTIRNGIGEIRVGDRPAASRHRRECGGLSRAALMERDLEQDQQIAELQALLRRSIRVGDQYRIRRPGAGRKLTEEKYPTIVAVLEQMLNNENEIAGDPMSEQKWVRSTPQRLSERLKEEGYQVSSTTVRRLLKNMGFSLKANQRKQVRSKNPERDQQFQYIASQRQDFTAAGLPIISVDSKKKELIGDYRNNGRVWCREADEVYEHDFPDAAECKAVPFGIYDVTRNEGYVVVGTSNNTPEFSVNAIARWWKDDGQVEYPSADRLLVLADGGGSNGARVRAWKHNLQENFCDGFGISVTVCHYPTGCSKWNPVEHRLFSQISRNWAGKPLRTLELMLGYIRGTTTTTGLQVKASLDDDHYKKGQRVKKKDFERLNLRAHTVCPNWNYTISPRQ